MKKDNLTINFRGKKMSILEAKAYINGLKSGEIKPELNNEERKNYLDSKRYVDESERKFGKESMVYKLAKYLSGENETEYLIGRIKIAINLEEANEHGKRTEEYIKQMSIIPREVMERPYGPPRR